MQAPPETPPVADVPELRDGGHLWILELIDGAPLRFQLQSTGAIRFGDGERAFDADEIPLSYRHAVRHVRERLDRDALRGAVDDVEEVTFFAEATHRHVVDYDWDAIPPILGFDVYDADRGSFLPPDAAEGVFRRLGLDPANAVAKEVRADAFDPDTYDVPDSKWYDGPAAGVVVRDKIGHRGTIVHPAFRDRSLPETDLDAAELAARYVTDDCLDALAATLADRLSFDALYERALERAVREIHPFLFSDSSTVDRRAFRSAISARVRTYLDDTENV
ncbi:MAG: hypothetical protein ABEI96_06235 [Haloarculaceae archaeon]